MGDWKSLRNTILENIDWGWIAGMAAVAGIVAFSIWMFNRPDKETPLQTPTVEKADSGKVKQSLAAEIDLQQLEDSLTNLETTPLLTEYSGDDAERINRVSPVKDTQQVEIENIIQSCYSNLSQLFASSEYILDDPLPEEEAEILENIELIERYLISDKERALERISATNPDMAYDEILRVVENSDPYQKFTIQSSRILRDLKKAACRLAADRQY